MRLEYGREGNFGRNAVIGEVKRVDVSSSIVRTSLATLVRRVDRMQAVLEDVKPQIDTLPRCRSSCTWLSFVIIQIYANG